MTSDWARLRKVANQDEINTATSACINAALLMLGALACMAIVGVVHLFWTFHNVVDVLIIIAAVGGFGIFEGVFAFRRLRRLQQERAVLNSTWFDRFSHILAATAATRLNLSDVAAAYRVLGVEQGTPLPEVKRVYHQLMRAHHPDLNQGQDDAEAVRLTGAYNKLRDFLTNQVIRG